jgi:two-component system, OmpR family, response regulator QseB
MADRDGARVRRILIVEDHVFFSGALELVLGRRIFEENGEPPAFRRAVTVAEGLGLVQEDGPFDLAIVDLMLPDGDGADVVRKIKASNPRTRVAVLSSALDLSGSLEAGADEVIGKMEDLQETVATLARLASGGSGSAS